MSGPYYGCDNGSCAEERTYPPSELGVFRGKAYCDECWDYRDEMFDDLPDDVELPRFNELPVFVPEQDRRISELQAELARLKSIMSETLSNIEYYPASLGEMWLVQDKDITAMQVALHGDS